MSTVVEVEPTSGDDQRDRDRVAMLWNGLAGLEAKTDHAHRTTVRDLFEPKRSSTLGRFVA